MDPLAEHSPNKSPYHYCSNNPINRTDPTGMCDDPNCTHGAIRRGWDSLGRGLGLWGHADSSKNFIKQNVVVTAGPIEQVGPMLSQDNSTSEQRIDNKSKYNEQQSAINTVNNSDNLGSSYTQLSVMQGAAYGAADLVAGEIIGAVITRAWLPSTKGANVLRHYTSESGYQAIMESRELLPSIGVKNARHGSGQYFTDLMSGEFSSGQVSRKLFGVPWNSKKLTHFIDVDVSGLNVIENASHNYLVPGTNSLSLEGRIVNQGVSVFK